MLRCYSRDVHKRCHTDNFLGKLTISGWQEHVCQLLTSKRKTATWWEILRNSISVLFLLSCNISPLWQLPSLYIMAQFMIVVVIVVIRVAVVVVVLESPYAATCEALGLETPHHASLLYDSGRRTLRPSPDPRSFRLDAVWPQRRLTSFQQPGCILRCMVSRDTDQPRAIKLRELRIIGDGLQWTRHSTAETAVELFATSVADRLPARDPVIFEYIQRPPHCCKQLTSLSQDIRTMVITVFFSCFGCEFSASFHFDQFRFMSTFC